MVGWQLGDRAPRPAGSRTTSPRRGENTEGTPRRAIGRLAQAGATGGLSLAADEWRILSEITG